MSTKVSYIYPQDLASLEVDENGNYIVPEGFEIYRVPTKQEKIAELQEKLDKIELGEEPSDDELIELGKMQHPYYMLLQEREMLQREIDKLSE